MYDDDKLIIANLGAMQFAQDPSKKIFFLTIVRTETCLALTGANFRRPTYRFNAVQQAAPLQEEACQRDRRKPNRITPVSITRNPLGSGTLPPPDKELRPPTTRNPVKGPCSKVGAASKFPLALTVKS